MASARGVSETVLCILLLPNVYYIIEDICFKELSMIF